MRKCIYKRHSMARRCLYVCCVRVCMLRTRIGTNISIYIWATVNQTRMRICIICHFLLMCIYLIFNLFSPWIIIVNFRILTLLFLLVCLVWFFDRCWYSSVTQLVHTGSAAGSCSFFYVELGNTRNTHTPTNNEMAQYLRFIIVNI